MQGNRNSSGKTLSAALAAAAAVSIITPVANAAIWVGPAGTQTWVNGANWDTNPTPPGSSGFSDNQDTATFNDTSSSRGVTVDANRNIKSISVAQSSVTATGTGGVGNGISVDFSGGPLLLSDGGAITYNSTTASGSIRVGFTAPIVLQGGAGSTSSYTFTSNKTGTNSRGIFIQPAATVTGATGKATTLTLNGTSDTASTQGNLIASIVSDGASGGTLSISKSGTGRWQLSGANAYTGTTTISDGSLLIAANNSIPSASAVTVSGGTLALGAFNNLVASLSLQSGSITGTAPNGILTIGASAFDIQSGSVSAILGGAGTGLNKTTAGTATLSGNNTFGGAVNISGGTLLANNTAGSGTGSGNITVNGGTFGGTGKVSGAVTVNGGGTLAPGGSIESLAVGGLTFNGDNVSTSVFQYELDTAVLNGDLVVNNGALTIDPDATIQFVEGPAGTVALNSKLTLINYSGALTGTFLGYADDSIFTLGANSWQINYNDTTGGSNFSSEQTHSNFVTLTAVPEPGSLALSGLGALALLRRKRRI
jgi:autotransporter-associated beta strand protein